MYLGTQMQTYMLKNEVLFSHHVWGSPGSRCHSEWEMIIHYMQPYHWSKREPILHVTRWSWSFYWPAQANNWCV